MTSFQVRKRLPNFLCNLFRNPLAPSYAITLDVFAYSSLCGKIALRDFPALGTAEFFSEPFRHAIACIHASIEFIDLFIEGIPPECHPEEHPNDPRRAVLDFARSQADSHNARGKCATGHAHEQRPAHEG